MWQAIFASWLTVAMAGQLELNAPQNAPSQPDMTVAPAKPPVNDSSAVEEITPYTVNSLPENIPQPVKENEYAPPIRRSSPKDHDSRSPPSKLPSSNYRAKAIQRGSTTTPRYTSPAASDASATENGAASTLPKTIVTRQTYFSVPFRLDAPQSSDSSKDKAGGSQSNQVVEVQLFVSHDRGEKWNFYTRVQPNQQRIPFRTATDGEYWFAVRTLNRAGKFSPENISTPGMIVVIDTKSPTILLSAESDTGGQVTAHWEISDPHVKFESLSLQFRVGSNGPWQPIAISEKDSTITDSKQVGEVTWWPQPGTQEVLVRAETADSAGNKAVGHAQVKIGEGNGSSSVLGKSKTATDARAMQAKVNGRIGNSYSSRPGANEATNSQGSQYPYLPPGETPRMVNTRSFELDYDLEEVGTSGVSRVEVFGTRDGGRTWKSYGLDSDNHSPIIVQAEEEGIYGFLIVVTSGAGLGDPPPKSGDKPLIWVGVDLTKPTAVITSAEFGDGENQLSISWEASDKWLAEKPVALFYGTKRGGPWTPVAVNLENTGHYDWPIDNTLPPLVFLRLELTDEAGNRASFDRPEPIPLDRSRPTVRIRDVRAAGK